MRDIAILVDSGTDVPKELVERYGIFVLPLMVNYEAMSFRDGVDITTDQVIDRLDMEIPRTSLPSPASVIAALREIYERGIRQVMAVTISSGLSGVYNLVRVVAQEFEGLDIRVLDTKNIGIGAGMIAVRAAEYAETGMTMDELERRLGELVVSTKVFFCIPSLKFLQRGGRIGRVNAAVGTLLGIRPVIACDEKGVYYTVKKARGEAAAIETAVSLAAAEAIKAPRKFRLAVTYSGSSGPARRVFEELERRVPGAARAFFGSVSSALAVHTGPGLIGVGVQTY